MQNAPSASYLERLGVAAEQVEEFLLQPELGLFQAAIALLLLHGGPMSLSALAAGLEERGFTSGIGDMEHSLRKAWHGRRPVYQDDAGRFGLELSCLEMEHFLLRLRFDTRPKLPEVTLEQPGDEVPLTQEELEAAFRDRYITSLSVLRQTVSVLDACGRDMDPWARARRVAVVRQDAWTVWLREGRTVQEKIVSPSLAGCTYSRGGSSPRL